MGIPGLRGIGLVTVVKESIKDFLADDMTTYAAALAYQILFSLFPFVIFLIALLGFLNLSNFFDWLQQRAAIMLPAQAMEPVNKAIHELRQPQGGLLSVGIIVAIWTASSGIRAVMNALNVAYDVREGRPAWKLYPLSIIYTIGVAVMLIFAAAFLVIGPDAMQWLAQLIGMEQIFVVLWAWLRWPVAFLILCLAVAIIYYVAPNIKQRFRFISPGAVFAVIIWIAGSVGFNYYVRTFADYNATYGSIGAIVVLLLYFYISSAVLLLGAEMNAVVERHAPQGMEKDEHTLS